MFIHVLLGVTIGRVGQLVSHKLALNFAESGELLLDGVQVEWRVAENLAIAQRDEGAETLLFLLEGGFFVVFERFGVHACVGSVVVTKA